MTNQVTEQQVLKSQVQVVTDSEPPVESAPAPMSKTTLEPMSLKGAMLMATELSKSQLVPEAFRGKPHEVFAAMQYSKALNVNPMVIMNNIYFVHGKMGFSAQFTIGLINGSGRIQGSLRYIVEGEGDTLNVQAVGTCAKTGEVLFGSKVSMAMAKAEGWAKSTKWQNMPELMLKKRAATFFGREYFPELLCGLQTDEEIRDVSGEKEPA
jgi:hypothetical protein